MTVELTDGRVLLRPYRAEDIEALYEAVMHSLVTEDVGIL